MKKFNIRVYGILINENKEVLVLDEVRDGLHFTKFPGGGLEWGEGVISCLKREFEEELGLHIDVGILYHINENFVASFYNPLDQLISVYYFVSINSEETVSQKTLFETPRWLSIDSSSLDDLTFPVDKTVLQKLKKEII